MPALIDPSAKIGANSVIADSVIIGKDVVIGDNCSISHNVVIEQGTVIGNNVTVQAGSIIGKGPLRSAISAMTEDKKLQPLRICDDALIGAGAVLYAGSVIGKKVLIGDLASVREDTKVGDFTIVGRGTALDNKVKIGSYCKLQTNVYIAAYSLIEDYVFIGPCVVTSNDNYVGRTKERFKHFKGVIMRRGARVGINCSILPGVEIGEDALIGVGSVVTHDVSPKKVVIGVPAREVRDVPAEQLLENQEEGFTSGGR